MKYRTTFRSAPLKRGTFRKTGQGAKAYTQKLGDDWLDDRVEAVLLVPSVIVLIAGAPDRNALINHRHTAAARITIAQIVPFSLDPQLFRT